MCLSAALRATKARTDRNTEAHAQQTQGYRWGLRGLLAEDVGDPGSGPFLPDTLRRICVRRPRGSLQPD
eukprot:12239931-Alexandrium_andersonii.AAC.1